VSHLVTSDEGTLQVHDQNPLQQTMQLARQSAYAKSKAFERSTGEGEGEEVRTPPGEEVVGGGVIGDSHRQRFAGGELQRWRWRRAAPYPKCNLLLGLV
jgi:hypothetical protein